MTYDPRSQSLTFSSRDLFLGVALVAALLGTYLTFGMFYAAPTALFIAIGLFYSGHRLKRRPYIWAARLLMLPAACLTGVALFANLFFGIGPVYSRNQWPWPISEIAAASGANLDGARVTCYFVDALDAEYVWRQRVPAARVDEVVAKNHLIEHTSAPQEWRPSDFPIWWRPGHTPNSRYFTGYLGKGDCALMYDPTTEWLYVWWYYDW